MADCGSVVYTLLYWSNSTDLGLIAGWSKVFFFIDDVFMFFALGEVPSVVGDSSLLFLQ